MDFCQKETEAQPSDLRARIKALMSLGLDQWNKDRFSDSKITYQQAQSLAKEEGQTEQVDICASIISIQDKFLNGKESLNKDRIAAKRMLWEAARRSRELKSGNHEIKILRQFCLWSFDIPGDPTTIEAFSKLDQLAGEDLFAQERARAWSIIGSFRMRLSQYSMALDYYLRCLKLSREFSFKTELIQNMNNAAIAYLNMGNLWNAKHFLEEALLLSNEESFSLSRGSLLHHLAIIHNKLAQQNSDRDEFMKAIDLLNEERALSSETNDKVTEITIVTAMAFIYLHMGEIEKASTLISPLLIQGSKFSPNLDLSPIWIISGQIALKKSDFTKAEHDFTKVLSNNAAGGPNLACISSFYGLAYCQEARGRLAEALEYYERSMDMINNIGSSIGDDINRSFFSQTKIELYEDWINCISLDSKKNPSNQIQALFHAIERIKARSFLEFWAKRTKNKADKNPVAILSFQKKYLDSKTAFIEYWLGQKKSYLIILTKDRSYFLELPNSSHFEESLSGYLEYLQEPHSDRTKELKGAARVYREVLGPVMDKIPSTVQHLIISSDGILNRLPFEALVMEEPHNRVTRRVIDRFSVSYVPSASAYARIVEQTTPRLFSKDLLLIGSPEYDPIDSGKNAALTPSIIMNRLYSEKGFTLNPLPYGLLESDRVASYFPRDRRLVLTGLEANESAIKKLDWRDYKIIHFAGHAFSDEIDPTQSALALASDRGGVEDGYLQLPEIERLPLNAELVVLSSCRTGSGKIIDHEGVLGLPRVFLSSGARTVVGSLWNVNDRSTSSLMINFYRHLEEGSIKAEALRTAKIDLIRSGYDHPFFWAGFILSGDFQTSIH